ncbi:hypothetical protein EKN09_04830 [Vibrio penaeicida]|nr:hypothetical protein EKN09_04830 [Vibrio penaeicida]
MPIMLKTGASANAPVFLCPKNVKLFCQRDSRLKAGLPANFLRACNTQLKEIAYHAYRTRTQVRF